MSEFSQEMKMLEGQTSIKGDDYRTAMGVISLRVPQDLEIINFPYVLIFRLHVLVQLQTSAHFLKGHGEIL